jgi:hypothetical protein
MLYYDSIDAAATSTGGILSTKDTTGFGSPRMGIYALIGIVAFVAIIFLLKMH